jgi:D-arabinose 1-dehydrogenase-like Zn-dependent alcohol dehydrogenase
VCPPLLCAGITVYAPLKRHFGANKECAIAGIGGLGHMAIKFSSKLGMKTTAISTSEGKRQEALSYGAIDFINSGDKD